MVDAQTTYYLCSGVYYTFPFAGCTYPNTAAVAPDTAAVRFSCNGALSFTVNTACTYPSLIPVNGVITGVSSISAIPLQFSCNGVLSASMNSACTYPNPTPVNGVVTGVLRTTTASLYSCNGQITAILNTLCTYPTPAVNGLLTGTPISSQLNNGGSTTCLARLCYLCNNLFYTFPFPGCTYPQG